MCELMKGGGTSELSQDINVITAEINAYQRVAGEAIFEIGRRLKHVRESIFTEKGHLSGKWSEWCKEINMNVTTAKRFIQVYEKLGDNRDMWHGLSMRVLYEIATLPHEQREQPHTIPSTGETKTVDEMTVRELREVKKALKAEQEARKLAEQKQELAQDIKENGLINPPVVTPDFQLIAGERRLNACKSLGWKQIEVRVMSVRDYEHQLRMEISENENRKEFTFSERVDWARRLEEVERIKAEERMKAGGTENFPQGRHKGETRNIVGEASGFGSGKQYEKAKFIADNADDETIAKLNEGASKRSNENVWHNATKNRRRTRNIDVPSNENVWHNATPTSYVTNSSQSVKNFLNLSQFWAVFWVCIVNGEND